MVIIVKIHDNPMMLVRTIHYNYHIVNLKKAEQLNTSKISNYDRQTIKNIICMKCIHMYYPY